MKQLVLLLAIVFGATALVVPQTAQAQCANCVIFGDMHCQHGPLQNPQANDCHENAAGDCVLVGVPCTGGGATEDFAFLENIVGSPTAYVTLGEYSDGGSRVYSTCQGIVAFVEYDPKLEVELTEVLNRIIV